MRGVGLVLILLSSAAWGHSWYDADCCSEKDCRQLTELVTEGPSGFLLHDGRSVPYGDKRVRTSVDKDFHICENSYKQILCLYVPGRGT